MPHRRGRRNSKVLAFLSAKESETGNPKLVTLNTWCFYKIRVYMFQSKGFFWNTL